MEKNGWRREVVGSTRGLARGRNKLGIMFLEIRSRIIGSPEFADKVCQFRASMASHYVVQGCTG